MEGWMDGYVCMNRSMYVCINVCMYERMHVHTLHIIYVMYVHAYVHTYICLGFLSPMHIKIVDFYSKKSRGILISRLNNRLQCTTLAQTVWKNSYAEHEVTGKTYTPKESVTSIIQYCSDTILYRQSGCK